MLCDAVNKLIFKNEVDFWLSCTYGFLKKKCKKRCFFKICISICFFWVVFFCKNFSKKHDFFEKYLDIWFLWVTFLFQNICEIRKTPKHLFFLWQLFFVKIKFFKNGFLWISIKNVIFVLYRKHKFSFLGTITIPEIS